MLDWAIEIDADVLCSGEGDSVESEDEILGDLDADEEE